MGLSTAMQLVLIFAEHVYYSTGCDELATTFPRARDDWWNSILFDMKFMR